MMVVVMTASLDCVLLKLLFSLVESQGCEKSALFVCLFVFHFDLAALGLHWDYPGCLVGEDRDNGEEEDGNEDGNEELQDAFVDSSYDRQSDVPAGWFILESNCS